MLAGWRDSNDEHPYNIWNLIDLLRAPGTIDWDAVAMEIENGSRNKNSDTTASVNTTQQRKNTIAPPSASQQPIFLAIEKKAPTYIIEKLLYHNPNAAKVKQFSTGLTPLFLAVSKGASPEIIRLLLETYPQAARQTAFNGCIALHLAKNVETAQLLLEAYPKGVKHCNDQGFLPLHRSAYSAWSSPEVVKLLIQVGLRQNVGGRKGRGGVLVKISHGALTPLSMINDVICNKSQQCNEERWAKFCYIAQAAVGDNMDDDDDESSLFKVLHAAITLGCADTVIQLALQEHPEQVSELDRHGHSALSCAARTKDSSSEVIQMLLNADSSMASTAQTGGRLPLHHMVVSGRPYGEGMEAVIHAAPQVLELRDPVTGLYPFLLAAAARKGDDLNTIYSLLRKSPWLVPPTVTASNNAREQQQSFHELLLKAHRSSSSVVVVAVLAILVHVLLRQILWN